MNARATLSRLAALAILGLAAQAFAQPYAYIPNYGSNNVSVVDTSTNAVTATVPLGMGFTQTVAASADGSRVYFANYQSPALVQPFDTATNTMGTVVTLGISCVWSLAVNPAGTRAYAASPCSHDVAVLDLTTNPISQITVIGGFNFPTGVVVSPDGSRVYVADTDNQRVAVIDAASNTQLAPIPTAGRRPLGLAIDASGGNLWVSHDGTPAGATRISGLPGAPMVSGGIATGLCPYAIALHPAGSTAYASDFCTHTITAINTTTLAAGTPVATGLNPLGVSVTPDGSRVLVANAGNDNVSVFDASLAPVTTVAVGDYPAALGVFIATAPISPPFDPVVAVAALRSDISATILTDTRLRNALLAPLNAAFNWLSGSDPNRITYACSNLSKFVTVVGQNYSYGKLDYATASGLIADANALRVELGCRNPNSGTLPQPT